MERVLSREQMIAADRFTIDKLGFSEQTLIERAGCAVADVIIKRLHGGRVLVCLGKGKNGEDGKVIAKILSKTHGFTVASINVDNGIFKLFDKDYDIIVDCIFGTGLNKNVEGKYYSAIEKINNSKAYVVSCDIPSGLNSDTGMPMGIAVKANLTVAIQEYKLGHFLNDGPDYTGEVIAKDIGISIWGDDYANKFTNEDAIKYFPERKRNVNKGCFGKSVIIGGSKQFVGSAILSLNALTSLKMGLGYSYLTIPESLFTVYAGKNPECIVKTIKDIDGNIVFDKDFLISILNFDSIAIGMGIGVSEEVYKTICFLLENYSGKLLIDADGLNSLSKYGIDMLKNKRCSVVLTPHIGEFSRLLKIDKQEILSDIIQVSKTFAKEYGVVLLLKNAVSVITDGKEVVLNTTGNNSLAKGGSGDVLSGLITGITARKEDFFYSVCAGAYVFGLSADIAVKKENEYTVTASDVIRYIPNAINSL